MLGGRVRRERARPWRSATGRDGCRLLFAAAILATSSVLCGSPTAARAEPQGQQPAAGSPSPPLLHGWAATLDYGHTEGPLRIEGIEVGDGDGDRATFGIEALVGRTGFARIEFGREWSDSDRVFDSTPPPIDKRGGRKIAVLGVTAGTFVRSEGHTAE